MRDVVVQGNAGLLMLGMDRVKKLSRRVSGTAPTLPVWVGGPNPDEQGGIPFSRQIRRTEPWAFPRGGAPGEPLLCLSGSPGGPRGGVVWLLKPRRPDGRWHGTAHGPRAALRVGVQAGEDPEGRPVSQTGLHDAESPTGPRVTLHSACEREQRLFERRSRVLPRAARERLVAAFEEII